MKHINHLGDICNNKSMEAVWYTSPMTKQDDLTVRIEAIEKRNASVTLDKKWETSWTRKLGIVILTYLVVLIYLYIISNDSPWINALVPPTGFFLSTLALGWLRTYWQSKNS